MRSLIKTLTLATLCLGVTGCNTLSNMVNPFYEAPKPVALLGEKNDNALNGSTSKDQAARQALEAMSTYQRAALPSPNKPVMYPAIVRLMWVPDHLNRYGDLVPAHYYYLKVLPDRPAVTDAFELEAQLNGPGGYSSASSGLPFVYSDESVR